MEANQSPPPLTDRYQAMLAHIFTASGAIVGFLALERAFARDFQMMFGWLFIAFVIDGVDGTIARRVGVREKLPHIDGNILDSVIDFLTYVIVPVSAIWTAQIMPQPAALFAIAIILMCSAVYFSDQRMKTRDFWFRGFPALWQVVLFYLLAFGITGWWALVLLTFCCAGMFVPIVFVHPVRVNQLRVINFALMLVWFGFVGWIVWNNFAATWTMKFIVLAIAIHFIALPLWRGSIWAADEKTN